MSESEVKQLERELRYLREIKRIRELENGTFGQDEIDRTLRTQIPPKYARYLDRDVGKLDDLIERRERDLQHLKTGWS